MSELAETIGRRLRSFRMKRKLSQEALAERCGLHPTYIGQVERGEKNATIDSIFKIATGLDISLSQLFEGIGSNAAHTNEEGAELFELITSLPDEKRKKLLELIKNIISL